MKIPVILVALVASFIPGAFAQSQTPHAPYVASGGPPNPTPPGPFAPNWDSIRENYHTPTWLQDAKFGIFIHWGLYSIPAHGSEWYPHHMYATPAVIKWHREHFGPQDKFGYKDFIPMFKAQRYDPVAWAALFKATGARYIVPVAEHHDGFAMYDSALTHWNAKNMGPQRDLIGELANAVRQEGLIFGLSEHRMEHWSFMYPAPDLKTDLYDPANAQFYGPPQSPTERAQPGEIFEGRSAPQSQAFLDEWLHRNQELVDKYHPQLVYFDNGVNARALDEIKLRFAAYYYNRAHEWGKEVTIATKRDAYLAGSIRDYERGRAPDISNQFWECDTSIAHNSWGYIDGLVLRNAGELIRELVDCVSKNGAYLLNVAPRADGSIPEDQQLRLLELGDWLKKNGEAIYGSRPWIRFGEGPTEEPSIGERGIINGMLKVYTPADMRFTIQRGENGSYALYATLFAWPADGRITITSLAANAAGVGGQIEHVSLLGSPQKVQFTRDASGLHVTLPSWKPSDFASVLKITGLKAP
ncbi:MAG TPA: alpha-L-fucosidase [Lacunisphaera sp.]